MQLEHVMACPNYTIPSFTPPPIIKHNPNYQIQPKFEAKYTGLRAVFLNKFDL